MLITERKIRSIIKEEIKRLLKENQDELRIGKFYINLYEDTVDVTLDVFVNGQQTDDINYTISAYDARRDPAAILDTIAEDNTYLAYQVNEDIEPEQALELVRSAMDSINKEQFINEIMQITQQFA